MINSLYNYLDFKCELNINSKIDRKGKNKESSIKQSNSSLIKFKFGTINAKILYVALIGTHTIFFGYFLFLSYQNLLLTIFESSFVLVLIIGLIYTYTIKNPYHFYFYIGIVTGSVIVVIVIPITYIIVLPEIIYILPVRGLVETQIGSKVWYLSMGSRRDAFRSPKIQLYDKKKMQKKYSMVKIGIISFICTLGFLITSILALIFYGIIQDLYDAYVFDVFDDVFDVFDVISLFLFLGTIIAIIIIIKREKK